MFTRQKSISIHMLLICAATTVLVTSLSHATMLRKLSLDDLVTQADMIAIGQCEKTESIWLNRRIYTVATIRVGKFVKGKVTADNYIKVYTLGGRVKKPLPVKMHVPGAAKVVQGEEMVLFLKARGIKKQHHSFVGMMQGKIPIKTDPRSGKKNIHYGQPIKGIKMVDEQGKILNLNVQPESTRKGGLENLLSTVEKIIVEQKIKAKKATGQKNQPNHTNRNGKGGVK